MALRATAPGGRGMHSVTIIKRFLARKHLPLMFPVQCLFPGHGKARACVREPGPGFGHLTGMKTGPATAFRESIALAGVSRQRLYIQHWAEESFTVPVQGQCAKRLHLRNPIRRSHAVRFRFAFPARS